MADERQTSKPSAIRALQINTVNAEYNSCQGLIYCKTQMGEERQPFIFPKYGLLQLGGEAWTESQPAGGRRFCLPHCVALAVVPWLSSLILTDEKMSCPREDPMGSLQL